MKRFLRVLVALVLAFQYQLLIIPASPAMASNTADVTVTATPGAITPPTITNGVGATNVTDTTARLNGEITNTGNENPTVWVFWGIADGGAVPAAWSNNATLGIKPLGTLYQDVGSLNPTTLYYYRYSAVNSAGTDWADSSANFTTLVTYDLPAPVLTLTRVDENTVRADWTYSGNVSYVMLQAHSEDYYPLTTGQQAAYYGDGTSCNLSWPNYNFELFVTAWGFYTDNITYSADYATASIGGEGMTELAASITGILPYLLLILLLAVIGMLSWWAFKTHYPVAFMVIFAVSLAVGLKWYDSFNTGEAMAIGMALILYSFCMAGASIYAMFERPREEEE